MKKYLFDPKGFCFSLAVGFLIIVSTILLLLSGCNRQIIDTTWKFDYAYSSLGGSEYTFGKVDSWTDFENSDMIQVSQNRGYNVFHTLIECGFK